MLGWILPLPYHSTEQRLFIHVFIKMFVPHLSFWLRFDVFLQCKEPSSNLGSSPVGERATCVGRDYFKDGWIHPISSSTGEEEHNHVEMNMWLKEMVLT